ncbi:MAG: class Ib ribonucleoside-diphosphate reductase assembly flavoprotein NrdI [Bacilli bacterium]|nr:class Ib ribonucleoside-diphosphate reductase assembly flavoprotein NrdI [Bacilli bacterium]
MKIVYASRTGNVAAFVKKLGIGNILELKIGKEKVNEKFVLVTFTDGYGELPEEVNDFLENNNDYLAGVAASGDKSYGEAYALAADLISNTYGVPIILKFEFDGTDADVEAFKDALLDL